MQADSSPYVVFYGLLVTQNLRIYIDETFNDLKKEHHIQALVLMARGK